MAAPAIYSTTVQQGVDINNVFYLDTKTYPEYPAPPFIPGEYAWGTDGSEWVYCTASVTIGAGNVVLINSTPGSWSVAQITNTNSRANFGAWCGVVGGSQGSLFVGAPSGTQTASYFWVQIAGNAQAVLCGLSLSAFTLAHSSTVAGAIGASGGVGTSAQIAGIVFSQTASVVNSRFNAVLSNPSPSTID